MLFLGISFTVFAVLHLPFFRKRALWDTVRERAAWAAGLAFLATGGWALLSPEQLMNRLPSALSGTPGVVYAGGLGQLIAGAAFAIKRLRKLASWGLVATLGAMIPLHQLGALHDATALGIAAPSRGVSIASQAGLMLFVWWLGRK